MNEPELAELERLAKAATPGPWHHGPLFWEGWTDTEDDGVRVFEVPHLYPNGATQPGVYVDPAIGRSREPDAAYIAAASPDVVLRLIEQVRAAAQRPDSPGDEALRTALAKLPPGPYWVEWPAEQGGAFLLWGRPGTPPDFIDGWAFPLVARGVDTAMFALADVLNALRPPAAAPDGEEKNRE